VSNPEDHQFPQDVVPSLLGPHSPIPGREFAIDTNPTTSNNNPISIDALLNTADYIAGSSQSQQLSTTGNSSIQIASGAALSGHEQDSTANEQAEIGSSRLQTGGLEPLAEADCLPSKRRRDSSIPCPDSSLSQPSNIVPHGQEEAIRSSPLGDTDMSTVPQTEIARQLVDTVEGNTLGSSSGAANERRGKNKCMYIFELRLTILDIEIEFVYSSPQKQKLDSHLEGPFRTSILAKFQSDLESHQQCIMVMFPRDWEQDVTFSITVDRKAGLDIIGMFDLQRLPQVTSPRGLVQPFANMPTDRLNLLGPSLHEGTVCSRTYKSASGSRCSCVYVFSLDDTDDDNITFSIMVGLYSGLKLLDMLGLQRIK
jgi:hypothetical protein